MMVNENDVACGPVSKTLAKTLKGKNTMTVDDYDECYIQLLPVP